MSCLVAGHPRCPSALKNFCSPTTSLLALLHEQTLHGQIHSAYGHRALQLFSQWRLRWR
jgi:hypothetical protein